ncbi:ATP/GTP-binding protein [Leucobacter sp. cx-42]|uniref:ATP/GTP-binding protein n=1 Tax=unclassified Leucobacter TaxID=2621730 RepID=UPI00165E57B6|nr:MULTISPECIES: ATP/GTP-binding protein [unclassified Leucobacter]MBC9954619.1 ATP/GTP-binding protein [Leucobacter sp. cx-42]
MKELKKLEQEIAVFGESGSGKSVLVSSFYGFTQEAQYPKENGFRVIADDLGAGLRLHQNYLGMKNSAVPPAATRFDVSRHSFSIQPHNWNVGNGSKKQPFSAARLTWHDYPGEWFEQEPGGPAEAERRVETFRSLLGADVAFLLVDAQRLLDNVGEEERYLKSLFANFRNTLLAMQENLCLNGEKLAVFPRIWPVALSKADLMPEHDVYWFRDLIIEKAGAELEDLKGVISGMIDGAEALSIGDDFMLISAAQFTPGTIDVEKRVGVDLILPLSVIMPFERHAKWAAAKQLPVQIAEKALRNVGTLAGGLLGFVTPFLRGRLGLVFKFVGANEINQAAQLGGDALQKLNEKARAKNDHLAMILTGFKLALEQAERAHILLRRNR